MYDDHNHAVVGHPPPSWDHTVDRGCTTLPGLPIIVLQTLRILLVECPCMAIYGIYPAVIHNLPDIAVGLVSTSVESILHMYYSNLFYILQIAILHAIYVTILILSSAFVTKSCAAESLRALWPLFSCGPSSWRRPVVLNTDVPTNQDQPLVYHCWTIDELN